jgi:rare lipoprotein A
MRLMKKAMTAAGAMVLALEAFACMPPPPQVPCQCPAHPTETASVPPAPAGPAQPAAGATQASEPPGGLGQRYANAPALKVLRGQATYYGDSLAGNRTASGEVYDPRAFTAAHRTLPFGTVVRVRRPDRQDLRSVYVRITDRGPFGERRRIIDVSRAAAEQLDMIRDGVVDVHVEVVAYPQGG